MGAVDLLRMVSALLLVLGLLVIAVALLRRHGHRIPGLISGTGQSRHLAVVERLALEPGGKRQLVLVKAGSHQHLILLAPEGTTLIESTISDWEPNTATPLNTETVGRNRPQDWSAVAAYLSKRISNVDQWQVKALRKK